MISNSFPSKVPFVAKAKVILAGPKRPRLGVDLDAAPVLRTLVVDGVGLRPRAAGHDARVKTWMVPDPHGDAVHVRVGDVPVLDASDATAPVVPFPSGTRVPGVTRPARAVGVDHEVPVGVGVTGLRPVVGGGRPLPGHETFDIAMVRARLGRPFLR